MSDQERSLTYLAHAGRTQELETRWLDAIEEADAYREDMLEALEKLRKNDKAEEAILLASTWLGREQERSEPAERLALGKEILLRCGNGDDLRAEILELYREVHADHPGLDRLLDISGLAGGKTALRAIRTLDICLNLREGDYLISRSDERIATVTEVDTSACIYTLKLKNDVQVLDPDELTLNYDPIDANDFRVLVAMEPARLKEMLDSDPVTVVIGILKSHQGQLDSDELNQILSPRYIAENRWKTWWSKAKSELRRCANVVLEGKSRTILTYHAQGQSLEDEILPQWESAQSAHQRLTVIENYLREAKARKVEPQPRMIKRLHKNIMARVNLVRKTAPAEALLEVLLLDRLSEDTSLPEGTEQPLDAILRENTDIVGLMGRLNQPALYCRAVPHIQKARPDDWPEIYATLLPTAPLESCESLAVALEKAGHHDLLVKACHIIVGDFMHHMDAVCWLWRGSSVKDIEPLGSRELLLRLLVELGEMSRRDDTPADLLRNARLQVRGALSYGKYRRFEEVIREMEPGLAATVHRTISRLDGLGEVVYTRLLRIILDTHPGLIKPKERIDPWEDDEILYCTEAGLKKQQAAIDQLEKVKIPENARAIGEAASHGDLSENSEYKFALEERDLLQARLMKLQTELMVARMLRPYDIDTNRVNVGTKVTLAAVDGSDRREIRILGPWESNIDEGVYNYRAPLCMKLRYRVVGDEASLDFGEGERPYRIENIASAL